MLDSRGVRVKKERINHMKDDGGLGQDSGGGSVQKRSDSGNVIDKGGVAGHRSVLGHTQERAQAAVRPSFSALCSSPPDSYLSLVPYQLTLPVT